MSTRVPGTEEWLELGGVSQYVATFGDPEKPVLLSLHGGPGYSDLPLARAGYFDRLLERFQLVLWDQRGAGRSFAPDVPPASMTLEQMVQDGAELAETLRDRHHADRIHLWGHSWGAFLGLNLVHARPDLFHALFALSPFVSLARTEPLVYAILCGVARAREDEALLRAVEALGPPPYDDAVAAQGTRARLLLPLGGLVRGGPERAQALFGLWKAVPGHTKADHEQAAKGMAFSAESLASIPVSVDLFETIERLEIPVWFGLGRYDYLNCAPVAEAFCTHVAAPEKGVVWFEESAHFPQFEEPERFQHALCEKLLP